MPGDQAALGDQGWSRRSGQREEPPSSTGKRKRRERCPQVQKHSTWKRKEGEGKEGRAAEPTGAPRGPRRIGDSRQVSTSSDYTARTLTLNKEPKARRGVGRLVEGGGFPGRRGRYLVEGVGVPGVEKRGQVFFQCSDYLWPDRIHQEIVPGDRAAFLAVRQERSRSQSRRRPRFPRGPPQMRSCPCGASAKSSSA